MLVDKCECTCKCFAVVVASVLVGAIHRGNLGFRVFFYPPPLCPNFLLGKQVIFIRARILHYLIPYFLSFFFALFLLIRYCSIVSTIRNGSTRTLSSLPLRMVYSNVDNFSCIVFMVIKKGVPISHDHPPLCYGHTFRKRSPKRHKMDMF